MNIEQSRSVFMIDAVADAGFLQRAVGLFSQRGLLPRHLMLDRKGEELSLCVVIDDLDADAGDVIAEKLRVSVLVEQVRLERFHSGEGQTMPIVRAA